MKKLKKALLLVMLFLLAGLVVGVLIALVRGPQIVRDHVESTFPGVQVRGDVDIQWLHGTIIFHDVAIERKSLSGEFKTVTVQNSFVRIDGGHLDVDLSSPSETSPKSGKTITAFGLDLIVHKGAATAILRNADVDPKQVCFASGTIEYPAGSVSVVGHLTKGCVQRDKSHATLQKALIPVTFPFPVPKMAMGQIVEADDVDVDLTTMLAKMSRLSLSGILEAHDVQAQVYNEQVWVTASKVQVDHPWIAPDLVWVDNVKLTTTKAFKDALLQVGDATFQITRDGFLASEGSAACSSWVDALPKPLPAALAHAKENFSGTLSYYFKMGPHPEFSFKNDCKYVCSASPIKELRQKVIDYMVYDADNNLVERRTGPGTPSWTSIEGLPAHVPQAFVLSEDPGFEHHHGVLAKALENSIKLDLTEGKFVRGGSTITMQLAKNLWLRRHKTLTRKAEEAFLTFALESCLTKAQILEMYLNVIEFGPDIYGIEAASRHYFQKSPAALSAEEAFYLASILPAPKKALPPEAGGLAKARRTMKALSKMGLLSDLVVEDEGSVESELVDPGWETL